MMRKLKAGLALLCFVILASNFWSMSRWSEARGVFDDICYLRQAHLFQRFGLNGLDTNILRDDDQYLKSKLKQINFPGWNDLAQAPCHSLMPATNKRVIQYPPGTGFLLSLFPENIQVVPLYVLASLVIFGFALLGIYSARSRASLVAAGAFGTLAIYLMINPAKASYSVPPTLVVCAIVGFLSTRLFRVEGRGARFLLSGLIGLLIGISVNFRLPNLFLSSGYFLFFLLSFLRMRKLEPAIQGTVFGAALLAGMVPTLVANAINAGSPLSTTYSNVDVVPPEFSLAVVGSYITDTQFVLLLLAAVWTALALRMQGLRDTGQMAVITAGNLVVNLAFFFTHPIFTPYYTIPVAMLSLWSLLFAFVMLPAEAVGDRLLGQPANA